MKGQIRLMALVAIMWLVAVYIPGCAILETRDAEVARPFTEQSSCHDVLVELDEAVALAGVRDTQALRIQGLPYYRVNRFLASFAGELSDDEARKEWLALMRRLGDEGRRVELDNLPKQYFPDLAAKFPGKDPVVELERCVGRLMAEDLHYPQRIKWLQDHAGVPDHYSTLARIVGLYPMSSWFVMWGVADLHNEARLSFQHPEAMGNGKIQWYVPNYPRPAISHGKLAAILERARGKSALGIPEPDSAALEELFDYYAPVWRISTKDDSDRIGRPFWEDDGHVEIDTSDPVVYRFHSFTRMDDQVLLQLNYTIWVPRRPSQGWFDILSGRLDGLIWRVTLDHQGRVLLYDSVHPCGCYHKYYPVSPKLHPLKEPPTQEPPLIFTKDIPTSEKGRVVIHLGSSEHYVVGLSTEKEQIEHAVRYRFDRYAKLRNLPYRDRHRSLFGPDGIVPGTERAEHWLVWPMGVRSTGAMRQRGHHAMALVGRQHFDDPRLFESVFRLQK